MFKVPKIGTVIQAVVLVPASLFLLVQMGGTVLSTTLALLLGVAVAAVMMTLYALFTAIVAPHAVKFLSKIQDPESRRLAAYLPAFPVYFGILYLPIGMLFVVKPFLPDDVSLMISWLFGLALTVLAVGWFSRKKPQTVTAN